MLLLDDDPSLRDVLSMVLEDAGYRVQSAPDGRAGRAQFMAQRPDIVVCDVNMPHVDGFSFCRALRDAGESVPIILLTSRDSEVDEALGLDLGADDYISKPASNRVLLARIAALLRRSHLGTVAPDAASEDSRTVGALQLSPARLEARYGGALLPLTVTEYRLVEALATRAGVVRTREQLLVAIRDDDSVVAERLVDTYVRSLRRKFERVDAGFDRIETRVGAGYRWRDEP
ncbi:MAG: response regulator transcription factor [Polyangiales bacterium]|nr:response regulator transcription factor [Myxococcales bacterium]MCB9660668.1 response regulator transcription factor [Sandaracinaceae bacterium]